MRNLNSTKSLSIYLPIIYLPSFDLKNNLTFALRATHGLQVRASKHSLYISIHDKITRKQCVVTNSRVFRIALTLSDEPQNKRGGVKKFLLSERRQERVWKILALEH